MTEQDKAKDKRAEKTTRALALEADLDRLRTSYDVNTAILKARTAIMNKQAAELKTLRSHLRQLRHDLENAACGSADHRTSRWLQSLVASIDEVVQKEVCSTCSGEGRIDSGGELPWGETTWQACPECGVKEEECKDSRTGTAGKNKQSVGADTVPGSCG